MIDWNRVAVLRAEIGHEDFAEVVALFLEEAEEVAQRLPTQKGEALRGDLHFLKGAALNLGFAALADLCSRGEVAAAEFDAAPVTALYQASRAAFDAAAPPA